MHGHDGYGIAGWLSAWTMTPLCAAGRLSVSPPCRKCIRRVCPGFPYHAVSFSGLRVKPLGPAKETQ